MKMYHWKSEALAEAFDGDILVIAEDISEARQKVITEYEKADFSFFGKDFDLLRKDLRETPVTKEVVFIIGSL